MRLEITRKGNALIRLNLNRINERSVAIQQGKGYRRRHTVAF